MTVRDECANGFVKPPHRDARHCGKRVMPNSFFHRLDRRDTVGWIAGSLAIKMDATN
jgi:hypothetical protein